MPLTRLNGDRGGEPCIALSPFALSLVVAANPASLSVEVPPQRAVEYLGMNPSTLLGLAHVGWSSLLRRRVFAVLHLMLQGAALVIWPLLSRARSLTSLVSMRSITEVRILHVEMEPPHRSGVLGQGTAHPLVLTVHHSS